jgi:hypothetical protein
MTGVQFPAGAIKKFVLFATVSRLALEPTQAPIRWLLEVLFLEVKRLGHESDHSPLSSAEGKNAWSHTSTLPYIFMAW